MSIRALRLVWDGLALQFAFFPILGLALQAVLEREDRRPRSERVAMLIVAGACMAGCAAADLLTLCIFWGLMDVVLMVGELSHVYDRQALWRQQHIWMRALSLLCLMVAAMLLAFDQGRTEWAYAALDRNVQRLLMVAAWLRLTAFPLPGELGTDLRQRLVSLSTGGYLWLRLGAVASVRLGQPWLALAMIGLAVMGLIAFMVQDEERRLAAMCSHGVAMLLLAPLIDPQSGFGVAVLMAIGMGVFLVMQIVWGFCPSIIYVERWQLLPWLVALGSIAGLPLTLGGVVHWHLLRTAYLTGQYGVLVISSISFALIAMAAWRSARRLWSTLPERDIEDTREQWARWPRWVGFSSLLLGGSYLLMTGIYPTIAEHLWRTGFTGLDIPGLRVLFSDPIRMSFIIVVMNLIGPLAFIWAMEHFAHLRTLWARPYLADAVSMFLALEWFYVGLRQSLAVLQATLRRLIRIVEESFALGWFIFFLFVFLIYGLRIL